jgi:hypothetical protein
MQSVAFHCDRVQRSRDWTPERRHRAEANVQKFIMDLATDPALPEVSMRCLRALYPLHGDHEMAIGFLMLAHNYRWSSRTVLTAVQAFLRGGVLKRCRGDRSCWIHDAR